MKVNLIYGTETGFTKRVGEQILRTLAVSNYWCSMKSLSQVEENDWTDCDLTIIGAPTWCEPRLDCLLYTSPSPRDRQKSRMPSSA